MPRIVDALPPRRSSRPKKRQHVDLPIVVRARHPKQIAKERERAAALQVERPVLKATRPEQRTPVGCRPATAREITEALTFAGDPGRPHDCMMARIAVERLVLHLESRGYALVALSGP